MFNCFNICKSKKKIKCNVIVVQVAENIVRKSILIAIRDSLNKNIKVDDYPDSDSNCSIDYEIHDDGIHDNEFQFNYTRRNGMFRFYIN